MTLGETIRLLRNQLELTQPELAEKAGIEQSYLSKLENDKGTPSFDIINRIAQALNLTGMGLVQKLSHSYIQDNLSHLPEIAAEYASVKQKREVQLTRRLLARRSRRMGQARTHRSACAKSTSCCGATRPTW